MQDKEWNKKLKNGQMVERAILSFFKKIDPTAHIPSVPSPHLDIVCHKVGDVEVKEDRQAHVTDNYAFEFQNYAGEPSGVIGTQAEQFVLVDYNYVIFSSTENFRYILREYKEKKTIKMGFTKDNGSRCQGWLIPRDHIILSPFVEVKERWFPIWN